METSNKEDTGTSEFTITIVPPPCYEPENPCETCPYRTTCRKRRYYPNPSASRPFAATANRWGLSCGTYPYG